MDGYVSLCVDVTLSGCFCVSVCVSVSVWSVPNSVSLSVVQEQTNLLLDVGLCMCVYGCVCLPVGVCLCGCLRKSLPRHMCF